MIKDQLPLLEGLSVEGAAYLNEIFSFSSSHVSESLRQVDLLNRRCRLRILSHMRR